MRNKISRAIGAPVAKLPDIVPSPLPDRAIGAERAGVPLAAGNGDDVAQRRDWHGVRAVDGGAISDFADAVKPPPQTV